MSLQEVRSQIDDLFRVDDVIVFFLRFIIGGSIKSLMLMIKLLFLLSNERLSRDH